VPSGRDLRIKGFKDNRSQPLGRGDLNAVEDEISMWDIYLMKKFALFREKEIPIHAGGDLNSSFWILHYSFYSGSIWVTRSQRLTQEIPVVWKTRSDVIAVEEETSAP
jgi:hypothetical protein